MGISSNADLIYGIHVTVDPEYPSKSCSFSELPFRGIDPDEDDEFDCYIARVFGGITRENSAVNFYTKQAEFAESFPIILHMHCSYDCPMWILGLRATHFSARRGYPTTLQSLPHVNSRDVDLLCEFIRRTDIPTTGEMGWVLCSFLG